MNNNTMMIINKKYKSKIIIRAITVVLRKAFLNNKIN